MRRCGKERRPSLSKTCAAKPRVAFWIACSQLQRRRDACCLNWRESCRNESLRRTGLELRTTEFFGRLERLLIERNPTPDDLLSAACEICPLLRVVPWRLDGGRSHLR